MQQCYNNGVLEVLVSMTKHQLRNGFGITNLFKLV